MPISRRHTIERLLSGALIPKALLSAGLGDLQKTTHSSSCECESAAGPEPMYEKPAPRSVAELERKSPGVSAVEVNDYSPCGYKGELKPSPPHADGNPQKAVLVSWANKKHRLVFSHEASYVPWIELPRGMGLCNQFFEGNHSAELFNDNGRKERNSFIDIVESGPDRAWIRWNYFCVHPDRNAHPVLRGTEDYVSYPNGLVWRRLTYETLKPGDSDGYSWQPIDFFCPAPAGSTWGDLFNPDPDHHDYFVGSVIDAYSNKRYDKFWDDAGRPRRIGDAALLLEISRSRGLAMIVPFRSGYLFTILGAASGFPSERSQVVDHSFDDTGGWGWGSAKWDHWPIGWLNSEVHAAQPGSPYPFHFGPFSHYITAIDHPIKNAKVDFKKETENMDLNRWAESHVYYTLTGMRPDIDSIRRLARQWLDKLVDCTKPESVADLP